MERGAIDELIIMLKLKNILQTASNDVLCKYKSLFSTYLIVVRVVRQTRMQND